MIEATQLPVQTGDEIVNGASRLVVQSVSPDDTDGMIVFYILTAGAAGKEWHFQLPEREFERQILAAAGATLTRSAWAVSP